jgi:hypothetical protein
MACRVKIKTDMMKKSSKKVGGGLEQSCFP